MSDDAAVHVGVVTYDNLSTIVACLESVMAAARHLELRVAVHDNASRDGTPDLVARHFPSVGLVRSASNLGFGAAHNRLLERTDARRALVLNPDVVLHPGCLERLLAVLGDDVALVGPRVEYPDGAPQVSFGPFPDLLKDLRQRWIVRGAQMRRPRALRRLDSALARPFHPDWVSGACLLVDADAFRRVGGFDERFHLYMEDVDLCLRLRAHGLRARIEPQAVCMHAEGGSPLGADERRAAYRTSRLLYESKHGTRLGRLIRRTFFGVSSH